MRAIKRAQRWREGKQSARRPVLPEVSLASIYAKDAAVRRDWSQHRQVALTIFSQWGI